MASNPGKPIDIMFRAGIRQDLETRLAPLGALAAANNVEFNKAGNLIRRDGFAVVGTSTLSKTNAYSLPAKRFATGTAGERLIFADDNTWIYVPSKDKVCEAGRSGMPSALRASLTGSATGADYLGTVQFSTAFTQAVPYADCGFVSPWLVVAYMTLDATGGTYSVNVDVIDTNTGARVVTGASVTSGNGSCNPAVQCRVIVTGSIAWIFGAYTGGAAPLKTIWRCRIDLSGSTITDPTGTSADLVTDATSGAQIFDVAPTQGGFVLVYAKDGAGAVANLYTTATTPALTATYSWLTDPVNGNWIPVTLAVRGAASSSERVQAAGYDHSSGNMQLLQSEFDWSSQVRSHFASSVSNPTQIAMVRTTATATLLAYSDYSSFSAYDPRGHIYFGLIEYNVANPQYTSTSAMVFAGYSIGSKFYVDPSGTVYSVGRFSDWSGFQSHYLLLDWGAGTSVGKPVPAASVANGRVPLLDRGAYTGIGGMADLGSGKFVFAGPVNVGASILAGQQVGVWTWESTGNKRFLSTPANGALVVCGGTPLIYDGQRLVELSFFSYPVLGSGSYTLSGAAGTIADGTYQYRFVWEWSDANGNRHQSPASPAVSVAVTGGRVTWSITPLHATRKQITTATPHAGSNPSDQQSPIQLAMYRTTVGGNNFYRHSACGVNNTATEAKISIYDGLPDAGVFPGGLAANEELYVQQSVLSSSAPPATIQPIVHARRLWGVDCERPERIWCTKSFQDGEAPGYNPALQITIPGAGAINGLAAQDGRLYALAQNGIYLASYGDGPTNTGQGTFPEPSYLTSTANCTEPRSVLMSQDGCMFSGIARWGTTIYIIRRGNGMPIDIGCSVRDELQACPVVRGAVDRFDKGRAEFLVVDSDTNPTIGRILYYHYDVTDDQEIGQWTVAKYIDGRALYCIGQWGNVSVVSEITTPRISIQTPGATTQDVGTSWAIQLDTCDLRPFGIAGYGSVDGVLLQATKAASSSISIAASYDAGVTYPESATWSTAVDVTGGPEYRRWESPTKKLPMGSVRYRITDAAGTGLSSILHGLAIEVTPIGGDARLPAAQMG